MYCILCIVENPVSQDLRMRLCMREISTCTRSSLTIRVPCSELPWLHGIGTVDQPSPSGHELNERTRPSLLFENWPNQLRMFAPSPLAPFISIPRTNKSFDCSNTKKSSAACESDLGASPRHADAPRACSARDFPQNESATGADTIMIDHQSLIRAR